MRVMNKTVALLLASLAFSACSEEGFRTGAGSASSAASGKQLNIRQLPGVDVHQVLTHTKVLSSDTFEGRRPGTKGEDFTVDYLIDQLRKIGLQPGNTDGTYIEHVPLVGLTT